MDRPGQARRPENHRLARLGWVNHFPSSPRSGKLRPPPPSHHSEYAVKVLIVDDHPIVISGCRALLAQRPDITLIEALDGEQGYKLYAEHQPDAAVIDIKLPGLPDSRSPGAS